MLPRGYSVLDRSQDALVLGDRRRRQQQLDLSSNPTTETVSSGRSDPASSAMESFTRPRRLRLPMLPERSTTRVRLTDGRSSAATSRAVTATRTSWLPSAPGAMPDSVRTARSASVGAGSPYWKALTHSSERTDSGGRPAAWAT